MLIPVWKLVKNYFWNVKNVWNKNFNVQFQEISMQVDSASFHFCFTRDDLSSVSLSETCWTENIAKESIKTLCGNRKAGKIK